MFKKYDHIIWGASLKGISKAAELSKAGKEILLLNKFGFPGGKITESLSCFFQKGEGTETKFFDDLLSFIRHKHYGVLFENEQYLLLHPEAAKRALWESLDLLRVDYLFHVVPIGLRKNGILTLSLFGREGHFSVQGNEVHDFSDDQLLENIIAGKGCIVDLLVNCFITGNVPIDLHGFNTFRRFSTPIGIYCSFSLRNISNLKSDQRFNAELDRLAGILWKNYGSRLMMVPIQPEIIIPNTKK